MYLSLSAFVVPRVKALKVPDDIEDASPDLAEMMLALLRPVSRGELKLASTDPNVQPLLDYNYLTESSDRERLRLGVRQALELAGHEGLRELLGERLEPSDQDLASNEALDAWMMREVVTFSHISGTCMMGPSTDPMAVVDQHGRVRGVEGTTSGGCLNHAGPGDSAHQPCRADDRRKNGGPGAPWQVGTTSKAQGLQKFPLPLGEG